MSLRLFDTYVIDKVQNFIAAALSSRGEFRPLQSPFSNSFEAHFSQAL